MVDRDPVHGVQRRVAGYHDVRMDGIHDLVLRCRGWSVLDIGCNRGMVGFELACNGARLIHGIDSDADAINVARNVFADIRTVQFRFETIDLRAGVAPVRAAFGDGMYDLVLLLAVVHKLARVMSEELLHELLAWFGRRAMHYVGVHLHPDHLALVSSAMQAAGLKLIHKSYIGDQFVGLGPGLIWARNHPGPELCDF